VPHGDVRRRWIRKHAITTAAIATLSVIATLALVLLQNGSDRAGSEQATVRRVCADDVVLRDNPDRLAPNGSARRVGVLQRGQLFQVEGKGRDGSYVRGRTADGGNAGWVLDENSWLCQ